MRDWKNLSLRYGWFVAGVAVNAFGISFITKSALGTSPISSVPYVVSLYLPSVSFGMTTFVMNMLFILGEIILLRKVFIQYSFCRSPPIFSSAL